MRSESDVNRAIDVYSDMIMRLCVVHLGNRMDVEDVFQNVFLKYLQSSAEFADEDHEKAWFIRVTINACHDFRRSPFFRRSRPLEDAESCAASELPDPRVIEAVRALPKKYRDVIYLYYYEGYTAEETAQLLKKNKNTVYTNLKRGRALLEKALGGEELG